VIFAVFIQKSNPAARGSIPESDSETTHIASIFYWVITPFGRGVEHFHHSLFDFFGFFHVTSI
jgi:hypothetical protein